MTSETLLHILDLFSRNWLTILVLVLVLPLLKLTVHSITQIYLSKIENKNCYILHLQDSEGLYKSLEIRSSDLKLSELKTAFPILTTSLSNIQDNKMLLDKRKVV